MKKYIVFLLLIYISTLSCSFAMSDKQYNDFKSLYNEFDDVDKKLTIIYKSIINNLNDEERSKLRSDQREWVKNGWDNEAKKIKTEAGVSEVESYIRACENRINYLKKIKINENKNKNIDFNNISTSIGIYNFYLGENLTDVLQKCIENKYYIRLFTNDNDLPNKFLPYTNKDTKLILNNLIELNIDKINGKYINIVNKNTKIFVNDTNTRVNQEIDGPSKILAHYIRNFIDLIPNDKNPYVNTPTGKNKYIGYSGAPMPSLEYINKCRENGLTHDQCYEKFTNEYNQEKENFTKNYIPLKVKLLKSFNINCSLDEIDNTYNQDVDNFLDNIFSNKNNNLDIKYITLKINNQLIELFFMNSPGINIENKLFFILLNIPRSTDNKIVSEINNIFSNRFGNPNILSDDASYYFKDNNLIFHNKMQQNSYYFINTYIFNYYVKAANMLYDKFKNNNINENLKGM